jgi:hypothetical protein
LPRADDDDDVETISVSKLFNPAVNNESIVPLNEASTQSGQRK